MHTTWIKRIMLRVFKSWSQIIGLNVLAWPVQLDLSFYVRTMFNYMTSNFLFNSAWSRQTHPKVWLCCHGQAHKIEYYWSSRLPPVTKSGFQLCSSLSIITLNGTPALYICIPALFEAGLDLGPVIGANKSGSFFFLLFWTPMEIQRRSCLGGMQAGKRQTYINK